MPGVDTVRLAPHLSWPGSFFGPLLEPTSLRVGTGQ
jgi:hypothetical protein